MGRQMDVPQPSETPPGALGPWGELPSRTVVQEHVNELTQAVSATQAKMIQAIEAVGVTRAIGVLGKSSMTQEVWLELYLIVLDHQGSWVEAWGTALREALLYATRDERTGGVEEGVRHIRQTAARRWIRSNHRHLIALDGKEVLLWGLGDL